MNWLDFNQLLNEVDFTALAGFLRLSVLLWINRLWYCEMSFKCGRSFTNAFSYISSSDVVYFLRLAIKSLKRD
jgi:hypothetical protein